MTIGIAPTALKFKVCTESRWSDARLSAALEVFEYIQKQMKSITASTGIVRTTVARLGFLGKEIELIRRCLSLLGEKIQAEVSSTETMILNIVEASPSCVRRIAMAVGSETRKNISAAF